MGQIDDVILFAEIVDAGSLSAASRKTGIPKSTLSRRLDDLEKSLGVQLLYRDPRRLSATDIGSLIYQHARRIHEEFGTVETLVENYTQRPSGTLRIACPAVLAELLIADYVIAFMTDYPDVHITLDTSVTGFGPHTDHCDIMLQPAREGLVNSDLIRKRILTAPYCLVAAPKLMARFGRRRLAPGDLNGCPGIGWGADAQNSTWRLVDNGGSCAEIEVSLVFSAGNLNIIRRLCLEGFGLARLPLVMCKDDMEANRLVLPLASWAPPPVSIFALYPSRRSLSLAGTLFIEGLISRLRKQGYQ